MLLLLVVPRTQHDHSKCFCFSLHQREGIPFESRRFSRNCSEIARKAHFMLPFSNVFVMLLLPAPQDNNKNKLTAGRVQSFPFPDKLLILLSESISSNFLRQFSSSFSLINRTLDNYSKSSDFSSLFFLRPTNTESTHTHVKTSPAPRTGRFSRNSRKFFPPLPAAANLLFLLLFRCNSRTRQRNLWFKSVFLFHCQITHPCVR